MSLLLALAQNCVHTKVCSITSRISGPEPDERLDDVGEGLLLDRHHVRGIKF